MVTRSVPTAFAGSTCPKPYVVEPIVIEPAEIVRLASSPLPVLNAQVMSLLPSRSVQYGPSTPKNIVRFSPPTFTADTSLGATAPSGVTDRSNVDAEEHREVFAADVHCRHELGRHGA